MSISNTRKSSRIQTTVSILEEAVEAVDALAESSGVSRSRLMDLAIRRFVRWASNMEPQDLQLIAEYEVTEPISGFVRRPPSVPQMPAVQVPPPAPAPVPPVPPYTQSNLTEDAGPATPPHRNRVPVEEPAPARVRDRGGRYSEHPGRIRK